jgi:hypothetical protein
MRTKPVPLVQKTPPILVPDGEYRARLVKVGRFDTAHGERMRFSYEIAGGPHAGAVLDHSAACSESPTGKLAALLRDLLGRDPTPEELRDGLGPEQTGLACRIIAQQGSTRSGLKYSTVQSVTRHVNSQTKGPRGQTVTIDEENARRRP